MLSNLCQYLWIVTTLIIILVGIYFLFYYNLSSFKVLKMCKSISKDNIKLLNLSLASKIGVGSISGIAIALIFGGKGTIFWIWISSFIFSIYSYIETKTGILYKEKNIGGPFIYIKNKLNNNYLSILYSIIIIFVFLFSFILIQSNTIILSILNAFDLNIIFVLLLLLIISYISISKGIERISKIVSFLVPIMAFIYILIGIIVLIKNINIIPNILISIIKEAFTINSFSSIPFIIGFQRSIFSNESAMGSTSMIVSLSQSKNYNNEAFIQIIGNYFISIIICTISALIIITTDYESLGFCNINGIEIINYAFTYHFGLFGKYLSLLIIILFAFSTIITSFYYGDTIIKYYFKNKKNTFTKFIVIIVIVLSSIANPTNIWNIVDISIALATLINIYALIKLRKDIKESG